AALRRAIIDADALVIASPEYAHGVSSIIKNALDWMVGNESFVYKPVALFNASPRATIALDALRETLRTMSARIVDDACIAVPLLGSNLSEEQLVRDAGISATLSRSLATLAGAAADRQTREPL
ncbi:MAG TPA: NAD(P)H-dependent oxidoreductase, partial [Steroidobacteraceae bacterium]|nr:NAD(P)H-dependent oxidoreductase [Steroidobacteraceae bacterium]